MVDDTGTVGRNESEADWAADADPDPDDDAAAAGDVEAAPAGRGAAVAVADAATAAAAARLAAVMRDARVLAAGEEDGASPVHPAQAAATASVTAVSVLPIGTTSHNHTSHPLLLPLLVRCMCHGLMSRRGVELWRETESKF